MTLFPNEKKKEKQIKTFFLIRKTRRKGKRKRIIERKRETEIETRKCHLPSTKKIRGTVDKDIKRCC